VRSKRLRFPIVIIALVALTSGCSGYKVSSFPPREPSGESSPSSETYVNKGQEARVVLKNGNSFKGTVTQVWPDSVSIGKVGNYGFEETVFLASEVDRIEVEKATDSLMTPIVGTVVIVGGVLVLAGALGAVEFGPLN